VFQQNQSSNPPIDDPIPKATPFPQAATSSSSNTQPIQNQSRDDKANDPAVTTPVQSVIQDQVLLVQNQQQYPAVRDKMECLQDGIYLVITLRLTSRISLSLCLRKFQK
jgi:hypothetical protein